MNFKLLVIRTVRAVRRDGTSRTLRSAISYIRPSHADDPFDSMYGTDTAGRIPLWRLKIASPNARFGWGYETSDPRELESCVKCIPEDPRNLSFIDVGCGKGRMLIAARELGFRKLIGVEFAADLAHIARLNLARLGASDAVIVHMDASDFCFPHEGQFVVYLFNPFAAEVMRRVLENLSRVIPRRVFIIYNNARCAELLDASGFLRPIARVTGTQYPTMIWSTKSDPE